MKKILIIVLFLSILSHLQGQSKQEEAILGKWLNAEKDLKVEVYKQNGQYRAKVIWFDCIKGTTMTDYFDKKNPDKALRTRPWLGLEVLSALNYNGGIEWNNGNIYDPNSGYTFRSVCRLINTNTLKVRGYWMYEWIGKSLIFSRVNE